MEQQTEMVTTDDQKAEIATTTEDKDAEIVRLRAALKKVNSESATHRFKAKELDELKAKIEAEKLSESERYQQKIEEQNQLLIKNQERVIRSEIKSMATTLGIIDPAVAAKLIDWADIEYDENTGDPTNVEDLLKELLKDKPYLAGKVQSQSRVTSTNPSRSSVEGSDIDTLVKKASQGKLSDEQYAALSPAVKQRLIQAITKKSW